jgi:hypothetical protein
MREPIRMSSVVMRMTCMVVLFRAWAASGLLTLKVSPVWEALSQGLAVAFLLRMKLQLAIGVKHQALDHHEAFLA